MREKTGEKGKGGREDARSKVTHSVSWHSWLARIFRMVFSSPSRSPPPMYPDPLSSSARAPPAGSDVTDPVLWAPTTTSGRRGAVLYYGSCSRFLESLISVPLVLFPSPLVPRPKIAVLVLIATLEPLFYSKTDCRSRWFHLLGIPCNHNCVQLFFCS